MHKQSLALTIMGAMMSGLRSVGTKLKQEDPIAAMQGKVRPDVRKGKGKGRTQRKASGAAALKRAATKRNNIRKHK